MAIVTTNDSQYLAETIGFALFDGISIVVESADYAKQAIDGYVSDGIVQSFSYLDPFDEFTSYNFNRTTWSDTSLVYKSVDPDFPSDNYTLSFAGTGFGTQTAPKSPLDFFFSKATFNLVEKFDYDDDGAYDDGTYTESFSANIQYYPSQSNDFRFQGHTYSAKDVYNYNFDGITYSGSYSEADSSVADIIINESGEISGTIKSLMSSAASIGSETGQLTTTYNYKFSATSTNGVDILESETESYLDGTINTLTFAESYKEGTVFIFNESYSGTNIDVASLNGFFDIAESLYSGNDTFTISTFEGEGGFVDAWAGNDIVNGSVASDTAYGGSGNDTLKGNGGDDVLLGESGSDSIDGGAGNDALIGGFGRDVLLGAAGNDELYGGESNDKLDGGVGMDYLDGESGDDSLSGGDGSDYLVGGIGRDTLLGGTGDDLLEGGQGSDLLTGGTGADLFIFQRGDSGSGLLSMDTISDFKSMTEDDAISFSGLLNDFAYSEIKKTPTTVAFTTYGEAFAEVTDRFLNGDETTGQPAGEFQHVTVAQVGSSSYLFINSIIDDNNAFDSVIKLNGVTQAMLNDDGLYILGDFLV